ncbi:hypothetical protein CMV_022414 [Castanea mollissima]|uniref:C-JID domain-containing protein n=1 Tax=Castanea mollissima TaxID=60419 RepID=A0A8J4VKA4_9ROSI|nr:hypothetical protein CMV_022414 [Castanea mollissima]
MRHRSLSPTLSRFSRWPWIPQFTTNRQRLLELEHFAAVAWCLSVWSAAFKVGGAVSRLHEQSSRSQPWSQKETRYETSITRKEDGFGIAFQTIIPGYEIPWWITHQRLGNSISIELPPNWCNSRWMGFALCRFFGCIIFTYSVEEFDLIGKTFGLKARVIALGDMPHCYYATEISLAQNLLRGTFGYCICLVMIGLLLLRVVNSIRLWLYLRALGQACLCGNVGSVCSSEEIESCISSVNETRSQASLVTLHCSEDFAKAGS